MNVLFIQKMAGVSGSENYFLHIMPKLKAAGINVKFLMVEPVDEQEANHDFRNTLEAHGITVYSIVIKRSFTFAICRYIKKLVLQDDIDIVQTNLIHADFYGAMTKLFFKRDLKILSVKHGYDVGFQEKHGLDAKRVSFFNVYYLLSKFSAALSVKVVTISKALEILMVDSKIAPHNKVVTIPYGFDFEQAKQGAQSELRYGSAQAIIIGRLVAVKQHALVIQIMPEIIEKYPDFKLLIVGSGELEAELKQQCQNLGISDNVIFLGFRKNVHDYLSASDFMVFPSSGEGFGIVILESWFNHKPVISFDVPAPNEIITNEQDGMIVEPFSTEKMMQSMVKLIEHPELSQKLGDNGYQNYIQNYTSEIMVNRTIAVYQQLLN